MLTTCRRPLARLSAIRRHRPVYLDGDQVRVLDELLTTLAVYADRRAQHDLAARARAMLETVLSQ